MLYIYNEDIITVNISFMDPDYVLEGISQFIISATSTITITLSLSLYIYIYIYIYIYTHDYMLS